jgi:hypothetical protein
LDQLARLVERIDPVRVSDHASFARIVPTEPKPGANALHAADLLPLPLSQRALDTLCSNVAQVQDRLRRPLAVENLSAYVRWREAQWDEPSFLNALARRTGCRLLVDVNNLFVNALNDARHFGSMTDPLQACCTWIDAIDPASVDEIHLAGHLDGGGMVIDDHGRRVCEPVWQVYRHAIERFGPVPTLIEWDTDIPSLDVLLDEAARARREGAAALRHRTPEALTPEPAS